MAQDFYGLDKKIFEPDEQLVENARKLAVKLTQRAPEADKNRYISPETVHDLHENGFLAMGVPRAQGGSEASLITLFHVYEILGGACASTAWSVGNHTTACRKLHETLGEAAEPYLRAVVDDGAVIAQGVVPTGDTRPTEGGFVSSGRWPFMSFSRYARWGVLSTMVPGPDPDWKPTGGASEPPKSHNRQLVISMTEPGVEIEDNWYTMTLRASMSNDLTLNEVFVPLERAPTGASKIDTSPALRVPPTTSFSPPTIVLGIAKAAIEDTIEYANQRSMSIGGSTRSSMPGNQFAIADAAMYVESARAFLMQESRTVLAKAMRDEPFDRTDMIRMRMAGHVARQNAQKAVEGLFVIRGAHGIYESSSFERYYRDVRVGTLPAPSAPDRVREQVGKYLFDIPADVNPRWG